MGRGDRGKCPAVGQCPFAPAECVLDQHRRRQVGENPDGKKAVLNEGEVFARGCSDFGGHIRKIHSSAFGVQPQRRPTDRLGCTWYAALPCPIPGAERRHDWITEHDVGGHRRMREDAHGMSQLMGRSQSQALAIPGVAGSNRESRKTRIGGWSSGCRRQLDSRFRPHTPERRSRTDHTAPTFDRDPCRTTYVGHGRVRHHDGIELTV